MSKRAIGFLVFAIVTSLFLSACAAATAPETAVPEAVVARRAEGTPESVLEELINIRTPEPTPTPGLIVREVAEAVREAGLRRTRVLGLTPTEWTSFGAAVVTALLAYLLGALLVRRVLPAIARRTPSELDDRLLQEVGSHLRRLIVVAGLDYATQQLIFLAAGTKQFAGDVTFVLALAIVVHGLWKTTDVVTGWYQARSGRGNRERQAATICALLSRFARVAILVFGLGTLLPHFGVNVTALVVAVGLGALAITLAARDTIADVIAGLIILIDQPFRIGDHIEIERVGTWGEVLDIGLRTTRVRTWRNREVIVPNAHISQGQVVNYSYPDPQYLVMLPVRVGYGTDVDVARGVISDAVRQVPAIVADKPVNVRYAMMSESAIVLSVEWWVASIAAERPTIDTVNTAVHQALHEAGIEQALPSQNVNVLIGGGGAASVAGDPGKA